MTSNASDLYSIVLTLAPTREVTVGATVGHQAHAAFLKTVEEADAALADACGLSPADWQTAPLLVNPPALNFIAVALLAELHGRMGYFPSCLRMRPVAGVRPPRYEVAEVLDLQAVRAASRTRRK